MGGKGGAAWDPVTYEHFHAKVSSFRSGEMIMELKVVKPLLEMKGGLDRGKNSPLIGEEEQMISGKIT